MIGIENASPGSPAAPWNTKTEAPSLVQAEKAAVAALSANAYESAALTN
jgi:hypothetical protein